MNCRKVNHLLSAYMDGELPGVEHRQIHEHVAHCTECAQEYKNLLQMKRLLAGMRVREAQTDMSARILEQVSAQQTAKTGRSAWPENLRRWIGAQTLRPQYLGLAACVAALGIVYTSYAIDRSDQIVWHPASVTEVASLPPAPVEDPSQTMTGLQAGLPVSNSAWTPVSAFDPASYPNKRSRRPVYTVPGAPVWSGMPILPGH